MNKAAGTHKSGQKPAQAAQKDYRPASSPAPSREEIIAFIAREREAASGPSGPGRVSAKISKREIARAFDIKGEDRIALKRLLRELEAEGAVERRRKGLHKAGLLPATVLADFLSRDRDGEFLAAPVDWDAAQGPAPKILVTIPRRQKPGAPAPGLGDRALLRVEPLPGAGASEPSYSGRVVKLLERAKSQILGIFRSRPGGGGRVAPIDKKNVNRGELDVLPGQEGDARDGDLVAVEEPMIEIAPHCYLSAEYAGLVGR